MPPSPVSKPAETAPSPKKPAASSWLRSASCEDQKAGRRRTRSVVLASLLLALLAFGPLAWRVADDLIGGEHISDIATQTSVWACILFPAILAAFLVAGWSRSKG